MITFLGASQQIHVLSKRYRVPQHRTYVITYAHNLYFTLSFLFHHEHTLSISNMQAPTKVWFNLLEPEFYI